MNIGTKKSSHLVRSSNAERTCTPTSSGWTSIVIAEILMFRRMSGVTFCLVKRGLDDRTFEQGLSEWRRRHPVEVTEDADASHPSVDASGEEAE